MTAPLTFCKDGFRLTACSQSRGTYVSLGVGAGGCLAMILNPAESDELEQLLAAARLNRQQPQKDQAA